MNFCMQMSSKHGDALQKAVEAVYHGMSVCKAAGMYRVPKSTVSDKMQKSRWGFGVVTCKLDVPHAAYRVWLYTSQSLSEGAEYDEEPPACYSLSWWQTWV